MTALWVVLWAAWAAVCDWRQRRIPNALTLGGAALALLWLGLHDRSLLGADWGSVGWALAAALALTLPGYALGQLGAGDVKMLGAFALMGGLEALLPTLVVAGLGAAGMAVLCRTSLCRLPGVATGKRRQLPMGVFFAAGIVASQLV